MGLAIRAGLAVLTLTASGAILAQSRSTATAQPAGSGECRDVTIVNHVNGREERSTSRMCRNAAGGWDPAGTATQATPSGTLPADFRGRITYQGTHRGELQQGRRGSNQYGGSLTVELTFNGNSVTGTFSGTGGINTGTMSGTRTGNRCRLIEANGGDLIEGECTRTRFSALVRSQGNRDALAARFEANATRFVDAAVEERERREAAARPPAHTSPSGPRASGSPRTLAPGPQARPASDVAVLQFYRTLEREEFTLPAGLISRWISCNALSAMPGYPQDQITDVLKTVSKLRVFERLLERFDVSENQRLQIVRLLDQRVLQEDSQARSLLSPSHPQTHQLMFSFRCVEAAREQERLAVQYLGMQPMGLPTTLD